jgi:dTDP-glucose pyrophosphorylase
MRSYKDHLIKLNSSIKSALKQLDKLAEDATLFVTDENGKLIGSLTDGDVRRGLINNCTLDSPLNEIIKHHPKFIRKGDVDPQKVILYRNDNYRILPVLDENNSIVNVINFRYYKSYLPVEAIIMAGGRGQRLQPLTDVIPKPLLKIGGKPIIEYGIDRLNQFGINNIWISVNYLGEKIQSYLGNGDEKNIRIEYICEKEPLGTIGAASKINHFEHNYVLVSNSDLLTNVDYEDFFIEFLKQDADFAVLTIPYQVAVPYAILETENNIIQNFKEKPTYTYYANGGIYLMKKEMLEHIPKGTFYNSTDLMEKLIAEKFKVISYPFLGYWLDIGKHDDFEKAKKDIQHINL